MKASELRSRSVVTLNNAVKAGTVEDVLFDPAYKVVLGFGVKKGAFKQSEAVLRTNVSAIGRDAITVATPDAINMEARFSELAGAARLSQVHGTKVMTEGGELLGTIRDLIVDDDARSVTAYELDTSLWEHLRRHEPTFPAQQVQKIGEGGVMIVANSTAQTLRTGSD